MDRGLNTSNDKSLENVLEGCNQDLSKLFIHCWKLSFVGSLNWQNPLFLYQNQTWRTRKNK